VGRPAQGGVERRRDHVPRQVERLRATDDECWLLHVWISGNVQLEPEIGAARGAWRTIQAGSRPCAETTLPLPPVLCRHTRRNGQERRQNDRSDWLSQRNHVGIDLTNSLETVRNQELPEMLAELAGRNGGFPRQIRLHDGSRSVRHWPAPWKVVLPEVGF
jgi:hypothetical protein